MGGVGGVHLITLARLGIGNFNIADPDQFDVGNFNRQYGATIDNLGRGKAEVMQETVRGVNPDVDLRIWNERITESNLDAFLDGVDVLIDGVDFFCLDAKRVIFREAQRRGIWCITAGPIGFSTAWITFSPDGMSFDDYFDLNDSMSNVDRLIAFAVGLAPKATHLPYMDVSSVNLETGAGPSSSLACQLAAGVTAAEAIKIVLGRGEIGPAPKFAQFDPYRMMFRKGNLRRGNRNWIQMLKRRVLKSRLAKTGAISS
tara:strand:- start:9410 stop:10183 length:774 start_codon:yes stop_codon:yes gene_type:complete